jgi:hypothetical protein
MIDGRIVYERAQDDSYGGSPQVNMDQSMILIMTSNLKWLILLIYLLLSIEMMYHQEGCNVSLLKKIKVLLDDPLSMPSVVMELLI